jgi:hypothetical protein
LIDSSHPDQLRFSVHENHILHFDFQQIFLPDSLSDELGSNGFVMFSIKPIEDLPEGITIENTAHIYFDFNPAVVTNTTNNILVAHFPRVNVKELDLAQLLVYPNPSTDVFRFKQSIQKADLYNSQSQYIKSFKEIDFIDMSEYHSGIYYLRVDNGNGIDVIRLALTN